MSQRLRNSSDDSRTRTKAVVALVCLITVAAINQVWLWGVVFALWAASGMLTGRAYLVEELPRKNFPLLCWSINIVWFVIGLSMIAEPFLVEAVTP